MSILYKYNYFSSFEAGNCVCNSSFERMINRSKHFNSTCRVKFKIYLTYLLYQVQQTVNVAGVYDAGARFDGVAQQNIPVSYTPYI